MIQMIRQYMIYRMIIQHFKTCLILLKLPGWYIIMQNVLDERKVGPTWGFQGEQGLQQRMENAGMDWVEDCLMMAHCFQTVHLDCTDTRVSFIAKPNLTFDFLLSWQRGIFFRSEIKGKTSMIFCSNLNPPLKVHLYLE